MTFSFTPGREMDDSESWTSRRYVDDGCRRLYIQCECVVKYWQTVCVVAQFASEGRDRDEKTPIRLSWFWKDRTSS